MTTLEIHANVQFSSVEEARVAGQAIEQFLGIKGTRGVRIFDFEDRGEGKLPRKLQVSLYPPKQDTSTITRGRQEVVARITNLLKNLHTAIPSLPVDANLEESIAVLDGKQWVIDYQRLFDNVGAHVEKKEVKEAFNDAVALTLQQEATRGIK